MRSLIFTSTFLLLSGFAAAQNVSGGYATDVPSLGTFAAPFEPRITTPSVSLGTIAPGPAGASNATFGNAAGARNSTLAITSPSITIYTPMISYDPSATGYAEAAPVVAPLHHGAMFVDLGAASTPGVRQLMASAGPRPKAARTYTNDDLYQISQSADQNSGTVKFGGKTEHVY